MPSQAEYDALNAKLTAANNALSTATANLKVCTDGRNADAAKAAADLDNMTRSREVYRSQVETGLTLALQTLAAQRVTTPALGYNSFAEALGDVKREFNRLNGLNGGLTDLVNTQEHEITALRSSNGKRWVDDGAKALAQYVADRMPGLRVSTLLGGPLLSDLQQQTADAREVMVMTLTCPDGRLYMIEVYRSAPA